MDLITLAMARKHVNDAIAGLGTLVGGDHKYDITIAGGSDNDSVSFDADNGLVEVVRGGVKSIVADYSPIDGIDKNDILDMFTERES